MPEFYERRDWLPLLNRTKHHYSSSKKHGRRSLSGSARRETRLIPVARNYKRVLSRRLFGGNGAAGDYRCEAKITVHGSLISRFGELFFIYKDTGENIICHNGEISLTDTIAHSNIVRERHQPPVQSLNWTYVQCRTKSFQTTKSNQQFSELVGFSETKSKKTANVGNE